MTWFKGSLLLLYYYLLTERPVVESTKESTIIAKQVVLNLNVYYF